MEQDCLPAEVGGEQAVVPEELAAKIKRRSIALLPDRPVAAQTPVNFELLGPQIREIAPSGQPARLWSAHVHVMEWVTNTADIESRWRSRAARSLFVQAQPRNDERTHYPGTLLIRCRVFAVTLTLNGKIYVFGNHVDPLDEAEFLIQSDRDDWGNPTQVSTRLSSALCVAGQFSIPDAVAQVDQRWKKHFEKFLTIDNAPHLNCCASGLIFDAESSLTWRSQRVPKSRFFVQATLPLPESGFSELIVFSDRESLRTEKFRAARDEFSRAFTVLESALNPRLSAEQGRRSLNWSSLELTDPNKLPQFAWHLTSTSATFTPTVRFRFDSGQWRMQFADQPQGLENISPRGVLSTMPEVSVSDPRTITGKPQIEVTLKPSAGARVVRADAPLAKYTATPLEGSDEFEESWSISQLSFEYRALEVARTLRELHALPTPRRDERDLSDVTSSDLLAGSSNYSDGKVSPQALWGFTPLQDGWAQLPFQNITEPLYLESLPQPPADSDAPRPTPLLRGAVSLGNDRPDTWKSVDGEVPWNVTLLDAADFSGSWTIQKENAAADFQLFSITLDLKDPEVLAEGLFWLAKHTPTPADALPDSANWVDAYFSPPLRTPQNENLYPSLFVLRFQKLDLHARRNVSPNKPEFPVDAELNSGEFGFVENMRLWPHPRDAEPSPRAIYDHLLDPTHSAFDGALFWDVVDQAGKKIARNTALAWRRHPQAPFIQSLPFTQSAVPPNHPMASRQLAPFQLDLKLDLTGKKPPTPDGWTFSTQGAGQWPVISSGALTPPASFWIERLPMTSLGLPGLTFDPKSVSGLIQIREGGSFPDDGIRPQYHHGLPYLDEIHALAQLSPDNEPNLSPAVQPQEQAAPPPALLRPDFEVHFQRLSELGFLAAASADDALVRNTTLNRTELVGAIEPLVWSTPPRVSIAQYPGSLEIHPQMTLSGEPANPPVPNKRDALAGIEGLFQRQPNHEVHLVTDPTMADYRLTGGSMEAALEGANDQRRIRDQRGLRRSATQVVAEGLLETQVELEEPAGTQTVFALTTLPVPTELTLGTSDTWKFWFRDLPIAPATQRFERPVPYDSDEHRGTSLPEGLSRRFAHLTGYEWRLGPKAESAGRPQRAIRLGPFVFFPLTLDAVRLDAKQAVEIRISGRLQLPLKKVADVAEEVEQITRHNAVQLVFERAAADPANIRLSQVRILGDEPDGPLPAGVVPAKELEWSLGSGQDAPVLRVQTLKFDPTSQVFDVGFRLTYTSHDVLWTLPLKSLEFPFAANPVAVAFPDPAGQQAVFVRSIDVQLKPLEGSYAIKTNWEFLWDDPKRMQLSVKLKESVFGEDAPEEISALLVHSVPTAAGVNQSGLALKLVPDGGPNKQHSQRLDQRAVQVVWRGLRDNASSNLQLLPGMMLKQFTPKDPTSNAPDPNERITSGFGVMSFTITEQIEDVPKFTITGGAFESLFGCEWGDSWQDVVELCRQKNDDPGELENALLQSSAGQIDAEYFCRLQVTQPPPATPIWESELMLSGVLEVTNLISWPTELLHRKATDPDNIVTLPATRPRDPALAVPFSHLRHFARILLNQHRIPASVSLTTSSGRVVQDVLVEGKDPDIMLDLAVGRAWSWQATVEHQLLPARFNAAGQLLVDELGKHDVRWSTVQEVRLCSPTSLNTWLRTLRQRFTVQPAYPLAGPDGNGESRDWLRNGYRRANAGLTAKSLLELLAGEDAAPESAPTLLKQLQNQALFVEASVTAFVRRDPPQDATGGTFSWLSYLPSGTTQAVVATLADFDSTHLNNEDDPDSWALLQLPLFGRLVHCSVPDAEGRPLVLDPVGVLRQHRTDNTAPPTWAMWLANWEDQQSRRLPLAEFDLIWHRLFYRLDPASLREGWFRLNLATASPEFQSDVDGPNGNSEQKLTGVLASALADGPAVLSRPEVLRKVYDPRREHLPPVKRTKSEEQTIETEDRQIDAAERLLEIVWHPLSLWVLQTDSQPLVIPEPDPLPETTRKVLYRYGFLGAGAILLQAFKPRPGSLPNGVILNATERQPTIHAAATLMPANRELMPDLTKNIHPQSLALSPYLRIGMMPVAEESQANPLSTVAELIAFDAARTETRLISTQLWTGRAATQVDLPKWGRESHARLAADSPVAIIRVRKLLVLEPSLSGLESPIRVSYSFEPIAVTVGDEVPLQRAFAIQARPQLQRRVEGMFGGLQMPQGIKFWQLAPPLVDGVQPIREHVRPGTISKDIAWPWGISALRVSVSHREGSASQVGDLTMDAATPQGTLWWQGLFQPVQFQMPAESSSPHKLLPINFRSDARPSDFSSWPHLPLPRREEITEILPTGGESTSPWQSVLSGRLHALITGSRPGAPFLLRPNLQSQRLELSDEDSRRSEQSGGVPVQHRAPRPAVLPRNLVRFAGATLQTWGSPFDLVDDNGHCPTLRRSDLPYDQAMIAGAGTDPGQGLELSAQVAGSNPLVIAVDQLASDQNLLTFVLNAKTRGLDAKPSGDWFGPHSVFLTDGQQTFEFTQPQVAQADVFQTTFADNADTAKREKFLSWLGSLPHGRLVWLRVIVGLPGNAVEGYRETLLFPFRVSRYSKQPTVPLSPEFILFEDPEYNRRLSSNTASKSAIVKLAGGQNARVTLSADRREYNVSGAIHYLFAVEPEVPGVALTGSLQFQQVTQPSGTVVKLLSGVPLLPKKLPSDPSHMRMETIRNNQALKPGDILRLKLDLNDAGGLVATLELDVSIVGNPVVPVPEAAYALLRQHSTDGRVECVRFAWGPEPLRVELLNASDLLRETVRRRAVFAWQDTCRVADESIVYAIQKIAANGSTHFPLP